MHPVALTIAGSDSGAGAGIQADLKTFSALGVYGVTAITAVTSQNTCAVTAVHNLPIEHIISQLQALYADFSIHAAKTGMLSTAEIIAAVAQAIKTQGPKSYILDPVCVATSGAKLIEPNALSVLKSELFPLAEIITPNLPEAAYLLGFDEEVLANEPKAALAALHALGARAVLLKGGHATGDLAVDYFSDGTSVFELSLPRIKTKNTHGTGCSLAAAITALRAKGKSLEEAVRGAKQFVFNALKASSERNLGQGFGPIDHFFERS
ncbi:bifunctional hydroxymethylpyrimidine kinase/phosphomethylpyrimidine kinase [bacterium]|nr:bifunctional hydroxymethylpyrimidine kinase/phosphomethylpyrimidine kinase [bacterium]